MSKHGRRSESWLGATAETVAVTVALAVLWYPAVTTANALAGSPFGGELVAPALFALALGGAYPFVAGGWSIGDLGECLLLLFVAALPWGVVVTIALAASGVAGTGFGARAQATTWLLASGTAYVVAFRTDVQIFR